MSEWWERIDKNFWIGSTQNVWTDLRKISAYLIDESIKSKKTIFASDKAGCIKNVDLFLKEFEQFNGVVFYKTLNVRHEIRFIPSGVVSISFGPDNGGFTDVGCKFYITNEIIAKSIMDILDKYYIQYTNVKHTYMITEVSRNLRLQDIGSVALPFKRGNYNLETLDQFDKIVEDLNSPYPDGRIVLIKGKPGVGKTYMIRGILNEVNNVTPIILPPSLISQLDGPKLLPVLLDAKEYQGIDKRLVLIMEDSDLAFVKRGDKNLDVISTVLNLGDGMLGNLLDVRIIATTNADSVDLDAAVTRSGRLNQMVDITGLEYKRALALYNELTGKEFDESYIDYGNTNLADIYKTARRYGWKPVDDIVTTKPLPDLCDFDDADDDDYGVN